MVMTFLNNIFSRRGVCSFICRRKIRKASVIADSGGDAAAVGGGEKAASGDGGGSQGAARAVPMSELISPEALASGGHPVPTFASSVMATQVSSQFSSFLLNNYMRTGLADAHTRLLTAR